jgi:hypothetical protein
MPANFGVNLLQLGDKEVNLRDEACAARMRARRDHL